MQYLIILAILIGWICGANLATIIAYIVFFVVALSFFAFVGKTIIHFLS